MTSALAQALPVFVPAFIHALVTNLALAADALALGLPAGVALGAMRLPAAGPRAGGRLHQLGARTAGVVVALLRAAPAFVVMQVLANGLPARWAVSAPAAVALALAAYAAGYVADNALAALADRRAGVRGVALPFLLGVARAYLVMVLSSGFGAALGVREATAVTLRALEQLPSAADRLWLIGGVVLAFVALRQAVYAAMLAVYRRLHR